MVLGCRLFAADDAPWNLQKPPTPIDVASLQPEKLAGPQTGSQPGEHPRMPRREGLGRDGHQMLGLLPRERVGFWLRLVSTAKMLAEAKRWVRWHDLVLHRRRQDHAQRAGNAAHRREREPLGPTGGDQLPAQDPYSKEIQDDLRRSAAIALAGELAESRLTDGASATEAELVQDRYLVRTRAAAVNLWKKCGCYGRQSYEGKCPECNALIASVRVSVGRIIDDSRVSDAIVALANKLADRRRLYGNEVSTFLAERGLNRGSEKDTLPASGAATCVVPR